MGKEKVTLTQMRKRLKEACEHQFRVLRHDHHQWLQARKESYESTANFYYGVVTQSRIDAGRIYDLYLESLGHGWKAHSLKENDRLVRRINAQKKEAASCSN